MDVVDQKLDVHDKTTDSSSMTHSILSPTYTPLKNDRSDDRGLETIELQIPRKQSVITFIHRESIQYAPSTIEHYGENEMQRRSSNSHSSTLPPLPARLSSMVVASQSDEEYDIPQERSFPVSLFLLEIGALVMVYRWFSF